MSKELDPNIKVHYYSLESQEAELLPFDMIEINQEKKSNESKSLINPQLLNFIFKIFNLVASGFLVITLLASYFNRQFSSDKEDSYYFYIMTFQYNSTKIYSIGDTSSYNITSYYYALEPDSVVIILLVLAIAIFVIAFFYFILTAGEGFYKHLYSNGIAIYMPFIFLLVLLPFGLPFVMALGDTLTIICLTIYSISFLITLFLYYNTRKEVFICYKVMIIQNILLSILLSFQLYYILFCICSVAYENDGRKFLPSTDQTNLVIFVSVLYFCVGMAFLTTYKDIIFSLVLVVIDLGILLCISGKSFNETVTMCLIVFFMFSGDIFFVFRYKAKLFWYNDTITENEERLTPYNSTYEFEVDSNN